MGDSGFCWFLIIILFVALVVVIIAGFNKGKEQIANKSNLQSQLRANNFNDEKTIDIVSINVYKQISFDFTNKKLAIIDVIANSLEYVQFEKIIECEIIEDNTTIMKGGIGRAVVGGVLAGGIGAVVGSTTRKSSDMVRNLSIRIITNDISNALVLITLIDQEIKRDITVYKNCMSAAQEIYSTIISIIESNKKLLGDSTAEVTKSIANQIRDLGKLKEEGLITEEEFTAKKSKLLDLN
jgi:hypothetical protein